MSGGTPAVSRTASEKRDDSAFTSQRTSMVKLDQDVKKLIAASKDGAEDSLSLINLASQRLDKIEQAQDLVLGLVRPV